MSLTASGQYYPRPDYRQVQDERDAREAFRYAGAPFPVEITFSPLHTEEGTVITSTIRDISDRKRSEEQIRQLNANLEERVLEQTQALLRSNEELQQFAYLASHDFAGAVAHRVGLRAAPRQALPGAASRRRRPVHPLHRGERGTHGEADP